MGNFSGYRVEISGTGFAYSGGEPIAGVMTGVRVLNAAGQVVLTISNLGSNSFINDLSQFHASLFGTESGDTGIGPNLMVAWGQLLAGNDTITGTSGHDMQGLIGIDAGNDVYNMGGGDDWIVSALGNDTINGGSGFDVLSYGVTNWELGAAAIRGATINVQTGVALDPWGGTDRFTGLEEFRGSRFNDRFIGSNTLRDSFHGLRGSDTIDGGANSFTAGGAVDADRRDEACYNYDVQDGGRRGIVVDLETSFAGGSVAGTIRDGFGNLDVVRDIERVVGTRYGDSFTGSRMDNVFAGGQGTDSYDGGAGFDALNFARQTGSTSPTAGLRIDFTRTTGQVQNDGFGNVETALNMEAVWGSALADQVKGNARAEEFWMADGRDTMTGGAGSDTFVWETMSELGDGDSVTDFVATGAAADKLQFYTPDLAGMTTTLTLVNGTAATQAGDGTFVFNTANDTLYWDRDGAGGAAAVAVVVLTGVSSLSAANFDLIM